MQLTLDGGVIAAISLAGAAVAGFWVQLNALRSEIQKEQDQMREDFNASREKSREGLEVLATRMQEGFDEIGRRYATRDDFLMLRADLQEIGRKIDVLMVRDHVSPPRPLHVGD